VEWILQNQEDNGSWGIRELDLSTSKCTLLSTLACVIALKKWNVGPQHIARGMKKEIDLLVSVVLNSST
jgi:ent-kaurene synthase